MVNQMHDAQFETRQNTNFNFQKSHYKSKDKQKDIGEYIDYEEID